MDETMFETGMEKRKATLGAAYVETAMDGADDFSRPYQGAMMA